MYNFLITSRLQKLLTIIEITFVNSDVKSYFHHTLRVTQYAYKIAEKETINNEVMIAAALVHDIGMVYDKSFVGHVNQTKEKARKILFSAKFTESEVNDIIAIAISHHPSNDKILSNVYEKILFDADNLELVGAFGILRWFGKIPDSMTDLKSSALLFKDIIQNSYKKRRYYFYTEVGRNLGESLIDECILICDKIEKFSNDFLFDFDSIRPEPIYNHVSTKFVNNKSKKTIVALCGFRCCGKSSIRKILEKYKIPVFDTNSVETFDNDSNDLSITEVLKRYSNNESYLNFVNEHLKEHLKKNANFIVIDSIKTIKDLYFLKEHYKDYTIKTIFIHAPFKNREERYFVRDIKKNIRNSNLESYDNELINLGILELLYNADYVVNNIYNLYCLEIEIKNILFQINSEHVYYE